MGIRRSGTLGLIAVWLAACTGGGGGPAGDAAPVDSAVAVDLGALDAAAGDAEAPDEGPSPDGAPMDATLVDALPDGSVPDAAPMPDAALADAAGPDAEPDAQPPECARDRDCDDGVACTGVERCEAGVCVSGEPVDCAAEQPACAVSSVCDPETDRCEDRLPDVDGDGQADALCADRYGVAGEDCDDGDAARFAAQREVCNFADDDCDGVVDEAYAAELDEASLRPPPPAVVGENSMAWLTRLGTEHVVTWSFGGPGRFNEDGYVAVVGDDGVPSAAPVVLASLGLSVPTVAHLGRELAVLWFQGGTLRALKLSADGRATPSVAVAGPMTITQSSDRALVVHPDGDRVAVLWTEQINGGHTRYRLHVQVLDTELAPLGPRRTLVDITARGRQYSPQAVWRGDALLVAWIGGYDLYGGRIDADGVVDPEGPFLLANLPGRSRGRVALVDTPQGARGVVTSEGQWRLFGLGDDARLSVPLTRLASPAALQVSLCPVGAGLLVAGGNSEGLLLGVDADGQPRGDATPLGSAEAPVVGVALDCASSVLTWLGSPPAEGARRPIWVAPVVERCGPRCDDPRFGGPDCDECADPRLAGAECDECAEGFRGPDCALCVSPRLEGPLCDQCVDARFVAPACTRCADESRAGAECDRQRLLSISCGEQVSAGIKAPVGTVAKWGSGGHGTEVLQAWDQVAVGGASNNYCLSRPNRFACFGGVGAGITAPPAGPMADVAIGHTSACAVRTADAAVLCWGTDTDGQTLAPPGRFTQVDVGWTHACAVAEGGGVECWGSDAFGESSPPEGLLAVEVEAGEGFTCARAVGGRLRCWGNPAGGRTAPPDGVYIAVAVGRHHACAIDQVGRPVCWGETPNGERVVPRGAFEQISAGDGFVCALRADGEAVCWGRQGEFTAPP